MLRTHPGVGVWQVGDVGGQGLSLHLPLHQIDAIEETLTLVATLQTLLFFLETWTLGHERLEVFSKLKIQTINIFDQILIQISP